MGDLTECLEEFKKERQNCIAWRRNAEARSLPLDWVVGLFGVLDVNKNVC